MARGRPRKQPSIADLQEQLRTQRGRRGKLVNERKKLMAKVEHLDREIAALDGGEMNGSAEGASNGRVGGYQRRNAKKLPDVIADVLKKSGKPMKVSAIVEAVEGAGYQSSSANFRGIVNQALIKDDRFSSSERGSYQMK